MRWLSTILATILLAAIFGSTTALTNSPPNIIKQPPSDIVFIKVKHSTLESSKPFAIECEAEGEPEPEFRWTKNGKNFTWEEYDDRIVQQHGRGSLIFVDPKAEDAGQYQCFASNKFGIATSNSVLVRESFLAEFPGYAVGNLQAVEGEPFSLQCEAPDGFPKPTVNWLIQYTLSAKIKALNNPRITLDPENTLWFSNVTRDDASDDFSYACSATSVFRNEYKIGDKLILNVRQISNASQTRFAPKYQYATPKRTVGYRGKRVELYCIYGGTPLPQTVWSKNGNRIIWNDRIMQGNYGKSLIIRQAAFEDEGSYTCDVSNGVGQAQSRSINLEIHAVPYFTEEPEIQIAAEDEEVVFKCKAAGRPEPRIQWIHNGKPIEESQVNGRRVVGNDFIKITGALKADTGNYGCNATNSLGYVYKDVYLNVLALPPKIQEFPRHESVVNGANITMRCSVFGAPKPLVKWRHGQNLLTGGRYAVLDSGDLQIQDVTFADDGDYTCWAENKFGNATASGSLKVKERTSITEAPQNYEVVVGRSATFRCNAAHDDTLSLVISWEKDGQFIDFENEQHFVLTNDNSLTIPKTRELDSGEYTCVAKTELDEATAKAYLIVQDVPNAPRVTGISCMRLSAEVNWVPEGDNRSPILHYKIETENSLTPAVWNTAFLGIPNTDFFIFVAEMTPGTTNKYRVIAYNKIGPSQPSQPSAACTAE